MLEDKLLRHAAFITAIFYIFPYFFPLFTPSEGTATNEANFGR
jgi:hypothetical protein